MATGVTPIPIYVHSHSFPFQVTIDFFVPIPMGFRGIPISSGNPISMVISSIKYSSIILHFAQRWRCGLIKSPRKKILLHAERVAVDYL